MQEHYLNNDQSVMNVRLSAELPPEPHFDPAMRRAPDRGYNLSRAEAIVAVKNALRYVPPELHAALAPEFLQELKTRGRIYGYRYRPRGRIHAKPVDEYEGRTLAGRALQVMIDNNLDFAIALYPYELVTYGESGQVFQNWMQYRRSSDPGHPVGASAGALSIGTGSTAGDQHQHTDGWDVRQ